MQWSTVIRRIWSGKFVTIRELKIRYDNVLLNGGGDERRNICCNETQGGIGGGGGGEEEEAEQKEKCAVKEQRGRRNGRETTRPELQVINKMKTYFAHMSVRSSVSEDFRTWPRHCHTRDWIGEWWGSRTPAGSLYRPQRIGWRRRPQTPE
jgi:hypothetical protein